MVRIFKFGVNFLVIGLILMTWQVTSRCLCMTMHDEITKENLTEILIEKVLRYLYLLAQIGMKDHNTLGF